MARKFPIDLFTTGLFLVKGKSFVFLTANVKMLEAGFFMMAEDQREG